MYEFECQKCGHRVEKLQKREETTDSIACPKCKGEAVKVWARSAVHFKGGGWMSKNK